jgi:hypothetical protein
MVAMTITNEVGRLAGDLILCLNQQASQFRTFLDLLARQRDALVHRDTAALNRNVAEQEQAIADSRRIEQQRQALTAKLAQAAHKEHDKLTLSSVTQLVAASDASRFSELQELLAGLQKEIERRKRLNATLIEQSTRCTGEALQWIVQRARPKSVYTARGNQSAGGSGHIAVNRQC